MGRGGLRKEYKKEIDWKHRAKTKIKTYVGAQSEATVLRPPLHLGHFVKDFTIRLYFP